MQGDISYKDLQQSSQVNTPISESQSDLEFFNQNIQAEWKDFGIQMARASILIQKKPLEGAVRKKKPELVLP